MRYRFIFLAVAFVIASAAPVGAGTKLTGDDIKAKYSGARVYASSPSGRVVMHDYNRDGTILGIVGTKDKPKDLDEGTW